MNYLIANSLVVEHGSFDLKSWRLEGELHKGQLVPSFKLLCLHLQQTLQKCFQRAVKMNLHVSLVDPKRLAEFNVGNEQGELAIKV